MPVGCAAVPKLTTMSAIVLRLRLRKDTSALAAMRRRLSAHSVRSWQSQAMCDTQSIWATAHTQHMLCCISSPGDAVGASIGR